jgi:hypothetical protein
MPEAGIYNRNHSLGVGTMSALNQIKPPWYHRGIHMFVLEKLAKRYGKGWEDGVCHKGGISSGTWIVMGNQVGMRLRQILALYNTQDEFLKD